jgi:hypothetical protein
VVLDNITYSSLIHYQILGEGLNNGRFMPAVGVDSPPRGFVQVLSESDGVLFVGGYFTR